MDDRHDRAAAAYCYARVAATAARSVVDLSRALAVLEVAARTRPTGDDALRAHYDARAKLPDTKGLGPLSGHAVRAALSAASALLPGADDTEARAALVAARAFAVEAVMAATGVDSGVATRIAAARAYVDALARCVAEECPTPLVDALRRAMELHHG